MTGNRPTRRLFVMALGYDGLVLASWPWMPFLAGSMTHRSNKVVRIQLGSSIRPVARYLTDFLQSYFLRRTKRVHPILIQTSFLNVFEISYSRFPGRTGQCF